MLSAQFGAVHKTNPVCLLFSFLLLTAFPITALVSRCQIGRRGRGVGKVSTCNARARGCRRGGSAPPARGVLKGHILKTRAVIERIIANARHARRDGDGRKTRAVRERTRANARHTAVCGNNAVFAAQN